MSFSLGLIDRALCLVVLSSSVRSGLYLAVRKKLSADSARFFLNGRSLSWPLVGAFANNAGAQHLAGLSGDAYRQGLSGGTVEVTTAWSPGLAAAFLFPFLFAIGCSPPAGCGIVAAMITLFAVSTVTKKSSGKAGATDDRRKRPGRAVSRHLRLA